MIEYLMVISRVFHSKFLIDQQKSLLAPDHVGIEFERERSCSNLVLEYGKIS